MLHPGPLYLYLNALRDLPLGVDVVQLDVGNCSAAPDIWDLSINEQGAHGGGNGQR